MLIRNIVSQKFSDILLIMLHFCFSSPQAEQEKAAKDQQIKTLNDEMGRQDEGIVNLSWFL